MVVGEYCPQYSQRSWVQVAPSVYSSSGLIVAKLTSEEREESVRYEQDWIKNDGLEQRKVEMPNSLHTWYAIKLKTRAGKTQASTTCSGG